MSIREDFPADPRKYLFTLGWDDSENRYLCAVWPLRGATVLCREYGDTPQEALRAAEDKIVRSAE